MKKITLFIFIYFFYSCSEKDPIAINLLPNDYDIVIRPFLKDSFEVFIPYKMKISNNSSRDIRLADVRTSRRCSSSSFRLYLENSEKASYLIPIPSHGSIVVTAFLQLPFSKAKIDSVNLSKKFGLVGLYKIQKNEFSTFNYFKDKVKNDSIYFRFEDSKHKLFLSKVGKIDSNKYCTKTADEIHDLISKEGKAMSSIFNPCNCK